MKEQNKTPEKRLCETQRANLVDAEFKTLVIRMLRELSDYGNNLQEEVKAAGIQTNDLEHKEKINIQLEQKEETRIQKNGDRFRNLWNISKCASI